MTDSIWFFRLVAVAVISEIYLSATWNRFYFRYGLPIFWRTFHKAPGYHNLPSVDQLQQASKSRLFDSIAFKQIGSNEFAFREKFFSFSIFQATPVMHGLLSFDTYTGEVRIIGHINWFIVSMSLLMAFLAGFPDIRLLVDSFSKYTILIGIFLSGIAFLYFIQLIRFSKIGQIASGM